MVESQKDTKSSGLDFIKLENRKPHLFVAGHGEPTRFQFSISEPTMIELEAWPLDQQSDPDFYLTYNDESVSIKNFHWKGDKIGRDKIIIFPEDPQAKIGMYYCVVMPFREGINQLGIKLTLTVIRPVNEIFNAIEHSFTLNDTYFCNYLITDKGDFEKLFLLLECSQKKHIQLYIDTKMPFPDHEKNKWCFGDLSLDMINQLPQKVYMRDILTQATPFQISEKDSEVYFDTHFDANDPFYEPDHLDCFDFRKLSQLTTFRDRTEDQESWLVAEPDPTELEKGIKVLIETWLWKFCKPLVTFGFYNTHPDKEPQNVSIKITERNFEKFLPKELQLKEKLFDESIADTDAQVTSNQDRDKLNLHYELEYVYGEVCYLSFIPVIQMINPQPGQVFVDLGSGGGNPMNIVAMNFPELKVCKGIELLGSLVELSKQITTKLEKSCEENGLKMAPVEVLEADILKADWSDGDIIYTSSVCFPGPLISGIADKCEQLKPGTKIISLKDLPNRDYLKQTHGLKVKMSWGLAQVYYYVRV